MTKYILPAVVALSLCACGSKDVKTDPGETLDVARILKQVNDAVESSIDPTDKDFPPITSVTLDLQVSVSTTVEAGLKPPVAMITANAKIDKQSLHHIELTFAPTPPRTPAQQVEKPKESRLAAAVRAVYRSVSHASDAYKFQHGSITLQCALRKEAGVGADVLGLVPISADVEAQNEVVQSLTLNFGDVPNKLKGASARAADPDDVP